MARAKKRGPPARDRDSDGDFDPKQKSPSKKKGSPQKKTTSPRKVHKNQQQETVDEGIAATPDDATSQAQVENDDSTYASSPPKPTSHTTPLQTPARKNAARSTRNNKKVVDPSSGSFEAESASGAGAAAGSGRQSKIVVLKVAAYKLRELVEANTVPENKVTLKVFSEKLRQIQQEPVEGDLLPGPAKQPEEPAEERPAKMAPVKDKDPHDVLDDHFKDVIQNFYDLASITHGYLPESHGPLVNKSIDITHSLAALSNLTADNSTHPAAPTIRSILIPPEVIDYVANGRNPDIYTREFVENVQRGNQVLNGKMQAFGQFAEMYARETKSAIPDMAADIDRLMEHSGGYEKEGGTGDWKMKKPPAEGS